MSLSTPALGALACLLAPSLLAVDGPPAAYLDPARPLEERVDDLVARMSLEERAAQMQDQAPGIPRLGVPAYGWWSEALHGVMTDHATVFPQAIGLAATFDTDLMLRVATAIGDEGRAKYNETAKDGASTRFHGLTMFSPNINIFRDPRWGRGQETYGEDPYLTARMGVAFVRGLQGDDARYLKLGATAKHYAVHSGPEPERHRFDAHPTPRDLRETYLPAFEALVREAKVESVMCAYNSVDGQPACANDALLGRFLRDEWGFRGYVVSDCGAIIDIHANHHWKGDAAEAAAAAVKAGTDLECADEADYLRLPEAVKRGLVSESAVDEAVKRLFRVRFRLGLFDPPERVAYARTPVSVAESAAHKDLALEAARESLVLLKNDGILPLRKSLKTIAVIGPNADDVDLLRGNYAGTASASVTPLAGIRAALPQARVLYAMGSTRTGAPAVVAVPSSLLAPPAGAGSHGLRGEYFVGREPKGAPAFHRTDAEVDFDWGRTPVRDDFPREDFSVRWTGTLTPVEGGRYEIGVTADDGFRLRIDGRTVVEDWTQHATLTRTRPVDLEPGKPHDVEIEYFQGPGDAVARFVWSPPAPPGQALRDAEDAARQADVVVAFLGLSSSLEGEEMPVDVAGFKGGDRTDIALPRAQEELLERLQATGKPVVLVLLSGSALGVGWAADHVPAILQAWYPGQAAGTAIADVLFGDVDPAGRLPVTFYKSASDLPPFEDYDMKGRTYRFFAGTPLYPFGHGLSYTRFRYGPVRLAQAEVGPGETARLSIDVTNAGDRAGDEVAQLYVTHLDAKVRAPIRSLAGVRRLSLRPGATATIAFAITPDQRRLFADDGSPVSGTGRLLVAVGGQQPGGPAATTEVKTAELTMRSLPEPTAADLESGAKTYATYCSRCHGFDGTGGMGPPLARPKLRHAADEAEIIGILANGIPGTAMMAAWSLSEREMAQVAAYVRSLGRRPAEKLPGDPERGKGTYARLGCAGCHIIDGTGAGLGPDLSGVGGLHGTSFLRESLLDPGAAHPERAVVYEPYAFPAYVVVHAQPRGAPEVTGVRVNEDSFTVQLRDQEGRLHSFRKADLERLIPERGTSLMPSYRDALKDAELDDLVAYLMTRQAVR